MLRTTARMWILAAFTAPKLLLPPYNTQTLDGVFQHKPVNIFCHAKTSIRAAGNENYGNTMAFVP